MTTTPKKPQQPEEYSAADQRRDDALSRALNMPPQPKKPKKKK
jgi:hypothetical protein